MNTSFNNPDQENQEERLWNFIDGISSTTEKLLIEKLIESNISWKEKYNELLEINAILKSSELETPSMRFSRNVMEEISKHHIAPATKSYINRKVIWGLGIFFITMLIGFLIYGIGQITFTGQEESVITKNLNKVDFSKLFSNTWVNVFMMVNVVVGLFLLDLFLSNKRKNYKKEA